MSIYLKRALRNKQFMLLFTLGLLMIIAVVFAQNFAPHDPYKQYYDHILENSSAMFPLGTDQRRPMSAALSRATNGLGRAAGLTLRRLRIFDI